MRPALALTAAFYADSDFGKLGVVAVPKPTIEAPTLG
jgi:hypothetical protein